MVYGADAENPTRDQVCRARPAIYGVPLAGLRPLQFCPLQFWPAASRPALD